MGVDGQAAGVGVVVEAAQLVVGVGDEGGRLLECGFNGDEQQNIYDSENYAVVGSVVLVSNGSDARQVERAEVGHCVSEEPGVST